LYKVCSIYKINLTFFTLSLPQGFSNTEMLNFSMATWINWQKLEQAIPLDELPSFHRAFLKLTKPEEADWDKVQGSLKALERQGLAKTEGETLLVAKEMIPEAFHKYVVG
jgi:hypothetical protein